MDSSFTLQCLLLLAVLTAACLPLVRASSSSSSSSSQHEEATVAAARTSIFFHVFLPPQDNGARTAENGARIAAEQLQVRALSKLASAPVYITIVGLKAEIPCEPNCHHIMHAEEGCEELTLKALHQHCLTHQDENVVYMVSGKAKRWRGLRRRR